MSLVSHSIHTFIYRIVAVGVGFLITLITARYLDVAGRGTFAMLTVASGILLTLFGGISPAITYQIANRNEKPKKVFYHALLITIGMSAIVVIIILTSYPWIKSTSWWFVIYLLFAAPFMLVNSCLSGLLLGLNSIKLLNYSSLSSSVFTLLLWGILLSTSFFTMSSSLSLWAVAQLLAFLFTIYWVRSYIVPVSISLDPELLKQMLFFGSKIGGVNLISALNYRIDMLVVDFFLGMEKVGIYSVAVIVAEFLWFISSSISTAAYTRIGQLPNEEAIALTTKLIRFSSFLVFLASLVLAAAGYIIIPVFFGEKYYEAILPFEVLIPGVAFFSIASILSAYFTNQMGKPHLSLYIAGSSFLINLVISLFLIPWLGMVGGALATTISYSVSGIFILIMFLRFSRIKLPDLLIKPADILILLNLKTILTK